MVGNLERFSCLRNWDSRFAKFQFWNMNLNFKFGKAHGIRNWEEKGGDLLMDFAFNCRGNG